MSKAFTKESDNDDDEPVLPEDESVLVKNYVTPLGLAALKAELHALLKVERPKIVETVSWAAKNGDRSENGDYIYGKKRLREIDRRMRYLTKRIENAELVDPVNQQGLTKIFFGATVSYETKGTVSTVQIVGIDEADFTKGKISWTSPIAKTLLKASVGDQVKLQAPAGESILTVVAISYPLT